ncbi:hypothetical protein ACL1CA_11990, partial [Corynebacterium striatum]
LLGDDPRTHRFFYAHAVLEQRELKRAVTPQRHRKQMQLKRLRRQLHLRMWQTREQERPEYLKPVH